MAEGGHEVASHAWRWTDYRGMPEAEEHEHIRMTVAAIREICGAPPLAWCVAPNYLLVALENRMFRWRASSS